MSMIMKASTIFYWLALGNYVLSSIVYVVALVFAKPRFRMKGATLAVCGLLLHSISLGSRWFVTGHGPYISTYEILSSNVWIAVLFFQLFAWRVKTFANLGGLVMAFAFLMMGGALLGTPEAKNLTPSLRSVWLVVHVLFAKITVASLLVALAQAIFYLLKQAKPEGGETGTILSKVPSPALLDDYSYRLTTFAFITLTIMIITGSIWANNSWGSYWAWDPTETWSLVVWFVYGIYLHGRITFRWKGTISAWYTIVAFIFSVVAFFVIPYFVKSLHSQYMVSVVTGYDATVCPSKG